MSEEKKKLISTFIAGFLCGFAVCAILILLFSHIGENNVKSSQKVTSHDSTAKSQVIKYTETIKKGKEDTTKTMKVISSKAPGRLSSTAGDSLKNKILQPDQVASWDTLDTKTGFFALVRYNITKNLWDNLFNVPAVKISRTDTLKTESEKETIEEHHSALSSETLTAKTEKIIPKWQLKLGADYRVTQGSEAGKYLTISYNQRFMFFYINLEGGIYNGLKQSLTGVKPLLKCELNLPLWE
ncbi:MAG: hypothetical protein HF314_12005 [Ignavibacteria bacterium]|jgi:hypothetical protein|nr:hypothetical protein [Ignavibacteria bacterium]MCU7503794.1 hypothetical protein [Ignavibacteria bacterium]MCU7517192.1 hypothetical protein [Ignavibacteria bacterium]